LVLLGLFDFLIPGCPDTSAITANLLLLCIIKVQKFEESCDVGVVISIRLASAV
jgi:hypothetical protein